MDNSPITIETVYNAPMEKVWNAISTKEEMKEWYFDIENFKLETGFTFEFWGGTENKKYLHKCEITEIIPLQKLAYTWRYDGYTGNSLVTFQLQAEGLKTRIKLTHSGVETFPKEEKDFVKSNFQEGWHHLITISLPNYLQQ